MQFWKNTGSLKEAGKGKFQAGSQEEFFFTEWSTTGMGGLGKIGEWPLKENLMHLDKAEEGLSNGLCPLSPRPIRGSPGSAEPGN